MELKSLKWFQVHCLAASYLGRFTSLFCKRGLKHTVEIFAIVMLFFGIPLAKTLQIMNSFTFKFRGVCDMSPEHGLVTGYTRYYSWSNIYISP